MSTMTETDVAEFRKKCVDFMDTYAVKSGNAMPSFEDQKAYLAAAAGAGLAGVPFAEEFGGGGLTLEHEKVWREVKGNYRMMDSEFIISHGMCLPMLNEYGNDEQKTAYMADMISGKTMWCQMFSEPGAGSDVASLQSKCELDGDEWILNGQKVWTTLAHKSQYGVVVARTDPEQVKHAGLSMFILDMAAPGVEIRPIHQIDGGSHFNEVFFTDVRIPKDHLLGEYNAGWKLATAMLMYERVAIGGAGSGKINQPTYKLLKSAAEESGKLQDPVVRDQLMKIYAMETTKSMVAMRNNAEQKAGKTPGPGGSLGKLFGSNIAWKMREIALEIAGMSSIAWDPADASGAERQRIVLNSFQSSIAGGTDEIQRNIIGDRVLGLPRDISVDKGVPFNQTKVGTQA
ncbi:acyl-CoA dehydrogenase family protein [Ilumatobacter sp.]|jgi:alkylation response protein AidB-like acyl-CoA dehydrogenase|uniref:acyl-CoA dehydrogenase family protein n=1 Tax=Ilumatobacter sp. TaxID=1967498 RepID=UPI003099058A